MAFDEELANRFRDALKNFGNISEKRMMGGNCFFLDGNMLGGADRTKQGLRRFMFRVGKDNHAEALQRPGAMPMDMAGRSMSGFIFVEAESCDDDTLADWVALARSFVATLPPK